MKGWGGIGGRGFYVFGLEFCGRIKLGGGVWRGGGLIVFDGEIIGEEIIVVVCVDIGCGVDGLEFICENIGGCRGGGCGSFIGGVIGWGICLGFIWVFYFV